MAIPRIIHYLAVSAILSPICLAQSARDKELARKLVGTWEVPRQQYFDSPPNGVVIAMVMKSATITHRADGTFKTSGVLSIAGHDVPFHDEGKWRVEQGVIIKEIIKCEPPKIPVGTVTKDTLLSVTDAAYRYRTPDGDERYRVRKRD